MNNKNQFNTSAFKQAIKSFDSFYAGDNSNLVPSSSGSYRFRYDDVKNLPEFKGVSKRVFLANKDMQDTAMDLAIDGKIPGRKGYDRISYNLKNKYNTKLRADEIAALAHIIGEEKTESFLANPGANNSAGISTKQLVQTLDKFNTAQGTEPSYRTKPKTQPQQTQEQVQMPMSEETVMPEQPIEQMQNVQPVQMPIEQSQPTQPIATEQLDISPMPEVQVSVEQMDPANQQLQQMTGVDGANPMAKGGSTDSFEAHYMHKGDRKIFARDEDAHFRLRDAGYGHKKLAEGGYADRASSLENLMNTISSSSTEPSTEPSTEIDSRNLKAISPRDAEIETLLPKGNYNNRQQQAQRDTIRAIREIYGNDVDQKTINNILGNVEIETGWGTLKEGAWSNDFLESKKDDPQYRSIVNNWKKYNNASKDNDYSSLSSKDKLSVMYYGDTDHSNFAGGRGVLQLTAADYGGNQNTEQEIKEAAEQLGIDPATNSTDFYNSTLLTLQTYKNRGHDFSTYDSAQQARTGAVNPYEVYDKLPDHKKDTLLNYSNLENNSSVNPEVIANSNMLSPEQKEKMMSTNDAGRGVPNRIAKNLSQEVDTSSAPTMSFVPGGVSPDVQQSLNELSMETFAKGGMIKRADGSYSKRGLWDNIRAAKGSGKKPTAAMLKQERKIKKMAEGGEVDPPTDLIGPVQNSGVNDKTKFGYVRPDSGEPSLRNPLAVLKKANWQSMKPITGNSNNYKNNSILSTNPSNQMDLSSLENSPGATAFSNTYNNPKTKAMMLAQTDLTSEQYDNMVVQGMEPKTVVGGNEPGSAAQYKNGTVYMGVGNENDAAMEAHERSHASQFDVIQQANIKKALGSAYKQGKDNKKGASYTNYIDQPHEQYGNFVQFREGLGLEPGTKISPEELNKLVKEKGLDQSGFYKTYNDENLSNALETVADTGNNNRYLNTAAMGGYMNKKQTFKQFQMALGGSVNDIVTKGGPNDLIEFKGGGTHEQNPLGGIPIGMNSQGQMNSVEEGESKYSFKDGDYVFSDRIKI